MTALVYVLRFARAYMALLALSLSLKREGFHQIFPRYVQAYALPDEVLPAPGWEKSAIQWLKAIDDACRCVPWDARCLHRSFLGYRYLRQETRLPVELVIGVQKFPFFAHAWLVYRGVTINESRDFVSGLAVILRSGGGKAGEMAQRDHLVKQLG
jgi:hypothetical protein